MKGLDTEHRRIEAVNRAKEMLHVAAEYIRQYAPEDSIDYDETTCDGYCVADDCESAAEGLDAAI